MDVALGCPLGLTVLTGRTRPSLPHLLPCRVPSAVALGRVPLLPLLPPWEETAQLPALRGSPLLREAVVVKPPFTELPRFMVPRDRFLLRGTEDNIRCLRRSCQLQDQSCLEQVSCGDTFRHLDDEGCDPKADPTRGLEPPSPAGAPGRIRTCGQGFRRALLCPLSY